MFGAHDTYRLFAESKIIGFRGNLQTMSYLPDMFELKVCKAIRELECFLCWSTMLLFVALDQKNQEGSFVTQRYVSLTKISSSDAVTVDSVYVLVFGN